MSDSQLAASRWDVEYRRGRYAHEETLPFVGDVLGILETHPAVRKDVGMYVGCGNGRNYLPLVDAGLREIAPYAVSMAYRVRFVMDMNAREAMHVIELRTAPAGHPAYRRVCQQMHTLIDSVAGHRAIAAAMRFADHSAVELERLQEERRNERKRQAHA